MRRMKPYLLALVLALGGATAMAAQSLEPTDDATCCSDCCCCKPDASCCAKHRQ